MSAEITERAVVTVNVAEAGSLPYETPTLEPLGNVRDLVAAVSGPYTDADSGDPFSQNFP